MGRFAKIWQKFGSYVTITGMVLVAVLAFQGTLGISGLFAVIGLVFLLNGIGMARRKSPGPGLLTLLLVAPALAVYLIYALKLPVLFLVAVGSIFCAGIGTVIGAQWNTERRTIPFALAGIASALILLSAFDTLPRTLERSFTSVESSRYPRFELLHPDGTVTGSDAYAGRVLVLDFWATWCTPCARSFPEVEKLYARYRDDPRVAVIALNTSWRGDTFAMAKDFARDHQLRFPIAFDRGARTTSLLSIRSIPTTVVFDKSGTLRLRHTGGAAGTGLYVTTLASTIDSLLQE
jgi:thiol-disulfide isomerase/thioredoxin